MGDLYYRETKWKWIWKDTLYLKENNTWIWFVYLVKRIYVLNKVRNKSSVVDNKHKSTYDVTILKKNMKKSELD